MVDFKLLQQNFKNYLRQNNSSYAPATINTYCSDAFFALNNDVGIDFIDILTTDDGIEKYQEVLSDYFNNLSEARKKEFPQRHIQNYIDRILQFKTFLDETYGGSSILLQNKRNYFWLNANPEIWSFLDKEISHVETFSLLNEKGNKRQNAAAFEKAKNGDMVVGYESQNIVAFLEIVEGRHFDDNEEVISVKLKEKLAESISIETLKNDSLLKNSSTVKKHQGTLFELTAQEFNRIKFLSKPSEALTNLIQEYQVFKTTDKYDEKYKWDFALKNQGIFNDLEDLDKKILQIGSPNFQTYFIRNSGIKWLLNNKPEALKEAFRHLFSDNNDFASRIEHFRATIKTALINDDGWKNKSLTEPGVDTASFFLFANDYTKYMLFTKVTPFNNYAKKMGIQELFKKATNEERYIEWQDYCFKTIIPKMNDVLGGKHTLLDAQDFIWYVGNQTDTNEQELIEKHQEEGAIMTEIIPLNQILYGPPGTGKTYNTATEALKILEPDFVSTNRNEIMEKYNFYRENNQIQFITFHQAYSYEEFVEGIRPDLTEGVKELKYKRHDGIFKKIVNLAQSEYTKAQVQENINLEDINIFKMSLGNTLEKSEVNIYDYCIENECIALGYGENEDFTEAKTKEDIENVFKNSEKLKGKSAFTIDAVDRFKNWMKVNDLVFISNGNTDVRAIGKIVGDYYFKDDAEISFKQFRNVKWLYVGNNIPFNKFSVKNLSQQSIYQFYKADLKFDFINNLLTNDEKTEIKKYVLVIDEINRGEISKIFGELITLIEDTKRTDKENLQLILPYSGEPFSLPSNLYIIGTMNTADRSIALLDVALRRRFDFIPKYPDSSVIGADGALTEVADIDLRAFLDSINERIEVLLDKDHTIGHSYLMGINSYEEFLYKFKNRILPLLQEYFYNDYEKIAKVLNQADIDNDEWKDTDSQIILKLSSIDDLPKYSINGKYPQKAFLKACE